MGSALSSGQLSAEDISKLDSGTFVSRESKGKSSQKEFLPNTASHSDQLAIATGLALLGLGSSLVASRRKKED